MKNLYLLSVHESAPCVLDMLRNLRACDPASEIAIYDSSGQNLLFGIDLWQYRAKWFPNPETQEWGRGSKAALAMFQWVCREFDFDVATCLDSDMLATREGYPEALARVDWGGTLGALSRSPQRMDGTSPLAPVRAVWSEYDLWRPWLNSHQMSKREGRFAHWSFGPGTVYSWPAIAEMCRAFSTEPTLQRVLNESRVLGLEEVIFITVIACLGYAIGLNPCSADYLKWRHEFSLADVEAALVRPDVFFIHPIAREYDNPLRTRIREAVCG